MFVCFLLLKKKEMPEYMQIAGSITMPYPLDLVYLWNSLWLFRNFTVTSIGCYRDTSRRSIPGYDGKNILIKDYYRRRADAILKCALVALRFGYRAFAVQHQGWCATGPRAHVTYRKYGRSNRCRNGKGGHGLMIFTLYLVRLMFVNQNTLHKEKIRASVKVSMVFFKVESKWGINFSRSKYDQTIKIALYYWKSTQKNIPVDGRMTGVQIIFNWWFKSITPRAIKKKQE